MKTNGVVLTESETAIFNKLKRGGKVSLDEIQKMIPEASRQALIVRLKYLGAKLAPHGYIIDNVGGVGRGAKAEYKMRKRF